MTKELAINAGLAGLWAGLAIVTASNQPTTKAVAVAAVVVAVRAAVGYAAARFGKPVPVDQ
jgi:hypothetical protein